MRSDFSLNKFPPFWRSDIETKSRQPLVFDPGDSTACLRACPFLGTLRALLCGEFFVRAPAGGDVERFGVE